MYTRFQFNKKRQQLQLGDAKNKIIYYINLKNRNIGVNNDVEIENSPYYDYYSIRTQ
jgi:hypothetical protein